MQLSVFAGAAVAVSLTEMRFEEAHRRVKPHYFAVPLPLEPVASFSRGGWVGPGRLPEKAPLTSWIHGRPPVGHVGGRVPGLARCIVQDTPFPAKFCCLKNAESFWWGNVHALPVDETCVSGQCIVKRELRVTFPGLNHTIPGLDLSPSDFAALAAPAPPAPLRIVPAQPHTVAISAILPRLSWGSLWFRPLLWATSSVCYSIALGRERSVTTLYNFTMFHPLASPDGLEGIFGLRGYT